MWSGSLLVLALLASPAAAHAKPAVHTLGELADRQAAYVLVKAEAARDEARMKVVGQGMPAGMRSPGQAESQAASPTLRRVFAQDGRPHAVVQWPDGRVTESPVGTPLPEGYRTVVQGGTVVLVDAEGQPVTSTAGASRTPATVTPGRYVPDVIETPPPPPAPPLGGGSE